MKECYVCGRKTVVQNFVWKNGKWISEERCCNPCCRTYKPYIMWKW